MLTDVQIFSMFENNLVGEISEKIHRKAPKTTPQREGKESTICPEQKPKICTSPTALLLQMSLRDTGNCFRVDPVIYSGMIYQCHKSRLVVVRT